MALEIEAQFRELRIGGAAAAVRRGEIGQPFGVVALGYPFFAHRREPGTNVDVCRRIGVRARRVVNVYRRILFRAHLGRGVRLADFAHRHFDIGPRALDVNFARIGQRFNRGLVDVGRGAQKFRICVHRALLGEQGGAAPLRNMRHASLRRHYPHQVRRVFLTRRSGSPSSPPGPPTCDVQTTGIM